VLLAPMVCCQTTPDGTVAKEAQKYIDIVYLSTGIIFEPDIISYTMSNYLLNTCLL
jgi:hypothetical protein